jgi:hypothetical protein
MIHRCVAAGLLAVATLATAEASDSVPDFSGIWSQGSARCGKLPAPRLRRCERRRETRRQGKFAPRPKAPMQVRRRITANRGKHLQLQFTVEDEGVFTMPWSATITYRPGVEAWREVVCAENRQELAIAGRDAAVPTANKPDF